MNSKINIIVPVYNVEKYICQCLDSILNQTYKHIKIIVVDDGSTDNSRELIKEKYIGKFDNIMLLEQENKGVSEARNLALEHIEGDYLLFVDPDDYLEKNTVETLVTTAIDKKLDVVICGYKTVYDDTVKGIDKYISPIMNPKEGYIYTGKEVAEMLLEGKLLGQLWNKLFKIENVKKYNMKFDSGRYSQDWYPVFVQLINANKIEVVDKNLYNYRQRGTSTVYKNSNKNIIDYYYAVNKIIEYVQKNNIDIDNKIIDVFKAIANNEIIHVYFKQNMEDGYKIYSNFYKSELPLFSISIYQLIMSKRLKTSTKLSLLLWNLKLRHIAFKIQNGFANN